MLEMLSLLDESHSMYVGNTKVLGNTTSRYYHLYYVHVDK